MRRLLLLLSRLHWQLLLSVLVAVAVGSWLILCECGQNSLALLDISTFISFVSSTASIIALFCSVSFGFVLFQMQSSKSERLSTYSELKSRLHAFQVWLTSQEDSNDKEVCMSMVFELEKLDVSDIPQTDYGVEYNDYVKALEEGLEDQSRREFYLTSILYSGYIEQLLSRLGVISIRQIITKSFLDTLVKGFVLVGLLVVLLFLSLFTYHTAAKPYLIMASAFFCFSTLLLFLEFAFEVYRQYEEDLDFIDSGEELA